MKALTVVQPYATAIVTGAKWLETRPDPPSGAMRPTGRRGFPGHALSRGERIAIHASQLHGDDRDHLDAWSMLEKLTGRREVVSGAIIGTVVVVDAVPIFGTPHGDLTVPVAIVVDRRLFRSTSWLYRSTSGVMLRDARRSDALEDQMALGDFHAGRWAWVLDDPVEFDEPVPCKGRQGVWETDRG